MQLIDQDNKPVYSDGQEIELRMLKIAQEYPEDLSEAYIADCYDYTTNNTFSSVRRNLLNWYPFRDHASVLEIGAGMGSLTGLLCDRCERVVAVEMNALRADVIRARYPSRKNLTVLVENIEELNPQEKFDYVVFVGVLEYAAIFSDSEDPFTDFIRQAASFLKKDGKLLFAIENQYGLKYWCGAAEDHLQKAFAGIEGYKEEKTARTFSKAALKQMLDEAGLMHQRFYGVLPDYKFPTFLFSEEWNPSGSELQNISYTYGKNSALIANEKDIYFDLVQNDVLLFFANSFLVEASASDLEIRHPLLITARGENKPEYRVITQLDSEGYLTKTAAHPSAQQHLKNIYEYEKALADRGICILQSEWKDGYLSRPIVDLPRADEIIISRLNKGDLQGVWEIIELLRTNLLKSSELSIGTETALHTAGIASNDEHFGVVLQNGYIDMTLYNAFWDHGTLVFYDQEWCIPNLPLEFMLYYAIKSIFARAGKKFSIDLSEVLSCLDIPQKRWSLYDQLEKNIWSSVFVRTGDFYGAGGYCTQYYNTAKLSDFMQQNEMLQNENARYAADLKCKQGHIELLLESERKWKAEEEHFKRTTEKLKTEVNHYKKDCEKNTAQIASLNKEKQELETQVDKMQQEVCNKEGHIALLLESERELERIKASRSWRFMGYFWKLRDALIPKGSKRRLFGKMLIKFIKHPIRFLRKCTPTRISKFFKNLRREGVEGTSRRLDDCLIGNEICKTELKIVDVLPENTLPKTIADFAPLTVPQWENPQVSIVIPVYNQFEYTYLCIQSIIKNSGEIRYEILIADDCSNDLTVDIEQVISGLRVIRNAQNLRFLRNCNNAAKHAKGQYILFLNNDTQVQEDWLAPLVELIERDETIGMVGSKLVYPDGRLQEAGGILWKDGSAWNYGNRSDPDLPEYNYVKEVDYISGAAIMIRRGLWEEIGGFDERFVPAYCEDSDLAFEVRKHGYKVMYQPKSVVVHFEGVSNGTDTSSGQKAYQVTNQKKFFEKWKDILEQENYENAQCVFQARDRSGQKCTVLFIDHYVPMYDRDAGSRTIYQYVKLLCKMGYHVKFLGDNFYPHQPYTNQLEQMGVEVLYGAYYQKNWKHWLRENGAYLDVVFLNRPHIAEHYIDEIKKCTTSKIIYNVCDLHFVREKREYEISKDKELLESANKWKSIELSLMEKSDVVFTLSSDEKQIIDEYFPAEKSSICPIFIYDDFSSMNFERTGTKDLLFVGGFNHRPNVDAVTWFCEAIMPRILEEQPDIRLNIVGSNPPDAIRKYESENVIIKGFVSDDELAALYQQCRVCVIPLRYGAGVKGKTIEAMYSCIPIVSTSIGIEGLPEIKKIITPQDSAEEFAAEVLKRYSDPDGNAESIRAAYEYIHAHYSEDSAELYFSEQFSQKER